MKKLLSLLTLLVCVVGGVQAAEYTTLFSAAPTSETLSVPASSTDLEITSTYATVSGGTMYVTSEQSSAKELIKSSAFIMTNNNTFFKVVMTQALQAGDVITVNYQGGDKNGSDKGVWVSTASSRPSSAPAAAFASSSTSYQDGTYTVTAEDEYVGATTFYIYRAVGSTQYFKAVTVTRPSSDPSLEASPSTLAFSLDPSTTTLTKTFTLTGANLTAGATVTIAAASAVDGLTFTPSSATVDAEGNLSQEVSVTYAMTGDVAEANVNITATESTDNVNATVAVTYSCTTVASSTIGYTEAINGTTLETRALTGCTNVTIGDPIYGSAITDQGSKTVYIDGTSYTNTKSWRKSVNGSYDNQYVGYTLTVASGYKMNISNVNARIAVADDTYTWYVEILNGAGEQVWKSGERTTTKASSGKIDNVDVSDKEDVQGLTGTVTVKLWMKQGGSTKYFSINYLQLVVTTEEDTRPTYAMSVSANDDTMGTFTPADGTEVTEGESVAFTATPNTGYKFVKWVIDDVDQTDNPYTISDVAATHTAVAYFAPRYTVTYDIESYKNTCTKVLNNVDATKGFDEVYSDDNDKYTIPSYAHRTLYNPGHVLSGWKDQNDVTYDTGDEITMTEDLTLTPVWTATTETIAGTAEAVTVTWKFAKSEFLFNSWQGTNAVGYYTKPQTVNGESIAVPMIVDATSGKVDNSGRTDEIAQVNQGTKFTIPAVSGMVVTIADAYKEISTTTIAGSTDYTGTGTTTVSYTYTGSDETIDIVSNESGQYLKTIAVTYPALASVDVTLASSGSSSYASKYIIDCANLPEGVKAYAVSAVSSSAATLTEIDAPIAAGTGIVLVGTGSETYTLPLVATATWSGDNLLTGVTTATAVEAESGYTYLALSGGKFVIMNPGTVPANKAYLKVADATLAGARSLGIQFGENVTTGIESIGAAEAEGAIYNMQGVRVNQMQKGLYIMNGKKILVK